MNQVVCSQIRHPAFLFLSYFIEGEEREIIDREKKICVPGKRKRSLCPSKDPSSHGLEQVSGSHYSLTKSNAASYKNIVKGRLLDIGNEL